MRISDWSSDVCSSDLLSHFGEEPPARCGNCDNCLSPPETVDATEAARKLLSAAFRTEMRFGITHRSEEHTSELQSLMRISYAVFCLKKKKHTKNENIINYNNYMIHQDTTTIRQ